MADLSTIDAKVKMYVKNCPSLMAVQALSDAARDFFTRSRAWRKTVEVALQQGTHTYEPDAGAGALWIGLNRADIGAKPLDPVAVDAAIDHSIEDKPRYYGSEDGEKVVLYPTPDGAYTLNLTLECIPAIGGTEIPDAMLAKYAKFLAHGAAADLLNQEGYPWYNPGKAAFHKAKFEEGVNDAAVAMEVGHTRASQSVHMRPLA